MDIKAIRGQICKEIFQIRHFFVGWINDDYGIPSLVHYVGQISKCPTKKNLMFIEGEFMGIS
ncbi:MAG: hypothetical protein ACTSWC_13265 [Promethearchaeota archaeon]